jgi:sphinganine-1-phosphate aldolase
MERVEQKELTVNTAQYPSDIGGAEIIGVGAMPGASNAQTWPHEGRPWSSVRGELISRKQDDYSWQTGRLPIYVYYDNDELLTVSREAYNLYFTENALGRRAFPSLARMEDEVIGMCGSLFQAPDGAAGSFASGGTESIFLALKTARDHFRAKQGRSLRPVAVVPRTAHPAFDKAAHYLDVEIVRTPIRTDLRADVAAMRAALDERTMLIAGSAPCYPYGVFDPIDELSQLAIDTGVWLHVDACLGGFLAPFARDEGYDIPEFDFSLPGVSSLSADLHKYGFSARGASVLLYRNAELKTQQPFHFDNWPRGSYSTETFLGSRPGGAIASAWAVAHYLGRAGYRKLARKILDAKQRLIEGIETIPGLQVLRPSELSIILYRSTDPALDINAVGDELSNRGWFVGRSREPQALHLALNAVHAPIIDEYVAQLRAAVRLVRMSGRVGKQDDHTY